MLWFLLVFMHVFMSAGPQGPPGPIGNPGNILLYLHACMLELINQCVLWKRLCSWTVPIRTAQILFVVHPRHMVLHSIPLSGIYYRNIYVKMP